MYTGKIYTSEQMKKMNTERLYRLFEKATGYSLFNPYFEGERSYMIVLISVAFDRLLNRLQTKFESTKGFLIDSASKLAQWWSKNGNKNAPTPTKGRIPGFTYQQIQEIYLADLDHPDLSYKDLAILFNTNYMNIYQILNGISYQWAMKGY